MQVHANGRRLWFDVEGLALVPDGPTMRERPNVVLLHGGPGSYDHSYLKPDFARLADVAQVVYLDLPGHGRSEWGDASTWSLELCADAVRDFCDALGISRPIVYGHSLGGFVAMLYGARHPGHGGGLVLQSTFARFDLERIAEEFTRAGGDEVGEIARRSYGGDNSVTEDEWDRCWSFVGPWIPGGDEEARTVVNLSLNKSGLDVMRRFDVVDQLSRIDCPTLVCVGEIDPITPVSAAREIVEAMPEADVRLEIVGGAGHFLWKDVPDRYWPLLIEFVAARQQ
jgi:pimeloyl-ACP methyl ester carboxylesterase